jgi:hypothetical protein
MSTCLCEWCPQATRSDRAMCNLSRIYQRYYWELNRLRYDSQSPCTRERQAHCLRMRFGIRDRTLRRSSTWRQADWGPSSFATRMFSHDQKHIWSRKKNKWSGKDNSIKWSDKAVRRHSSQVGLINSFNLLKSSLNKAKTTFVGGCRIAACYWSY